MRVRLDTTVQKIGYRDYNHYLRSTHWKSVRKRLLKSKLVKRNLKDEPVCECCYRNDIQLHIHHKTYKSLGKEKLMHLALVCELCHSLIHQIVLTKPTTLWKASMFASRAMKKERLEREATWTTPKVLSTEAVDLEAKNTKINFGNAVGLVKKWLTS
jgi:uncharacterized radical SAM superfamily Fe-S cluster-containing enzyme